MSNLGRYNGHHIDPKGDGARINLFTRLYGSVSPDIRRRLMGDLQWIREGLGQAAVIHQELQNDDL